MVMVFFSVPGAAATPGGARDEWVVCGGYRGVAVVVGTVAGVRDGTNRAGEQVARREAIAVASDAATSADQLTRLANDRDVLVRAAVAANPSTPASVQVRLLGDGVAAVARTVAQRRVLSPAVAQRVAVSAVAFQEDYAWWWRQLTSDPSKHEVWALHADRGTRVAYLRWAPDVPVRWQSHLARDAFVVVRHAVAVRATDGEVLDRLQGDRNQEVRDAAAARWVALLASMDPAACLTGCRDRT